MCSGPAAPPAIAATSPLPWGLLISHTALLIFPSALLICPPALLRPTKAAAKRPRSRCYPKYRASNRRSGAALLNAAKAAANKQQSIFWYWGVQEVALLISSEPVFGALCSAFGRPLGPPFGAPPGCLVPLPSPRPENAWPSQPHHSAPSPLSPAGRPSDDLPPCPQTARLPVAAPIAHSLSQESHC